MFDLQDQRIVDIGLHQRDRTAGADAPDTGDLDRVIHQMVAVEKHAHLGRQMLRVRFEEAFDRELAAGVTGRVKEQRRLVAKPADRARRHGNLLERRPHRVRVGAVGDLPEVPARIRIRVEHDAGGVDPRVPDVQRGRGRKLQHLEPVRARCGDDRDGRVRLFELDRTRRQHETHRQPLEVPLPRPRRRLIEVGDVEDQAPFRRRKRAEVQAMGIAAKLHRAARSRACAPDPPP